MPHVTPTAAPRGHQSCHVGGGAGRGWGHAGCSWRAEPEDTATGRGLGRPGPGREGQARAGRGGARGLAASEPELRWVRKKVSTLTTSVVLMPT